MRSLYIYHLDQSSSDVAKKVCIITHRARPIEPQSSSPRKDRATWSPLSRRTSKDIHQGNSSAQGKHVLYTMKLALHTLKISRNWSKWMRSRTTLSLSKMWTSRKRSLDLMWLPWKGSLLDPSHAKWSMIWSKYPRRSMKPTRRWSSVWTPYMSMEWHFSPWLTNLPSSSGVLFLWSTGHIRNTSRPLIWSSASITSETFEFLRSNVMKNTKPWWKRSKMNLISPWLSPMHKNISLRLKETIELFRNVFESDTTDFLIREFPRPWSSIWSSKQHGNSICFQWRVVHPHTLARAPSWPKHHWTTRNTARSPLDLMSRWAMRTTRPTRNYPEPWTPFIWVLAIRNKADILPWTWLLDRLSPVPKPPLFPSHPLWLRPSRTWPRAKASRHWNSPLNGECPYILPIGLQEWTTNKPKQLKLKKLKKMTKKTRNTKKNMKRMKTSNKMKTYPKRKSKKSDEKRGESPIQSPMNHKVKSKTNRNRKNKRNQNLKRTRSRMRRNSPNHQKWDDQHGKDAQER